jgi:Mce-associated membrane protein
MADAPHTRSLTISEEADPPRGDGGPGLGESPPDESAVPVNDERGGDPEADGLTDESGAANYPESPDAAEAAEDSRLSPGTRRLLTASAGLAVVLVVLVVASIVLAVRWQHDQAATADRQAAIAAARQEVVNLTSLNSKTSGSDMQQILNGAADAFRSEFKENENAFESIVTQAGMHSAGHIDEAGIATMTGSTARVLLAADATMQSSKSSPETRSYRIAADMVKQNGRWLLSNVEFIP